MYIWIYGLENMGAICIIFIDNICLNIDTINII